MLKLINEYIQNRNKKLLTTLIYQEVMQDAKAEQKTIELYQLIRTCLNGTFYNDGPLTIDAYAYDCFKKSQYDQTEEYAKK